MEHRRSWPWAGSDTWEGSCFCELSTAAIGETRQGWGNLRQRFHGITQVFAEARNPLPRLSLACVSPGTGSPLRSSSALGHIQDGVADSGSQLDQTCQTKYSALLWGISLVPPFFSSCLHSLQGLPTNSFQPLLSRAMSPFMGVCVWRMRR